MAAKEKKQTAGPGDRFVEGTVCRITDDGLYLGREADGDEACPELHKEYIFGERRVFLSQNQGPIREDILHRA